jgi:hypothetical protein
MGKGNKVADTSGLEQATREANALQERMYNQNIELAQPFYDTGVSSMGRLADLLGLQGGSTQSRDQIYQDLLPQYTAQNQGSGFVNIGGSLIDVNTLTEDRPLSGAELFGPAFNQMTQQQKEGLLGQVDKFKSAYSGNLADTAGQFGLSFMGGGQGETDYAALNAAVEEALAGQELPSDFGALTERFDLTKFEEDPGYQYRQQEAQQALERGMAAQGVTLGGGGFGNINPQVAKALQEQSQGMASQEYGNAYNRYTQDNLNQYNMLAGLAGYGQVGLGSMTNAGSQFATNSGNLTTGLASAQMNAQMAADAKPNMFGSLLGAGVGAYFGGPMGAQVGSSIGGQL